MQHTRCQQGQLPLYKHGQRGLPRAALLIVPAFFSDSKTFTMQFFNPKTAFFALAAVVLMVQCAVATTLSPTLELLGPLVREGDGPVIAYNAFLARLSTLLFFCTMPSETFQN